MSLFSYTDPAVLAALNPVLVPIGRELREVTYRVTSLCDVRTAEDLPERCLIGSVDAASFVQSEAGWSVRYVDAAPESDTTVRYKADSKLLTVAPRWRGIAGPVGVVREPKRWVDVIRWVFPYGIPADWAKHQQSHLHSHCNIEVLTCRNTPPAVAFCPDAFLNTVVCPVPATRLSDLPLVFDRISQDERVACGFSLRLEEGRSAVAYVLSDVRDFKVTPETAWRRRALQTGIVPREKGFWSRDNGVGKSCVVLGNQYNLIVDCAFRDVEWIVEHLHVAGLIGGADPAGQVRDADAPEARAIVVPTVTALTRAPLIPRGRKDGRKLAFLRITDEKTFERALALNPCGAYPGARDELHALQIDCAKKLLAALSEIGVQSKRRWRVVRKALNYVARVDIGKPEEPVVN